MSNFYCHPGIAGGFPNVGLKINAHMYEIKRAKYGTEQANARAPIDNSLSSGVFLSSSYSIATNIKLIITIGSVIAVEKSKSFNMSSDVTKAGLYKNNVRNPGATTPTKKPMPIAKSLGSSFLASSI